MMGMRIIINVSIGTWTTDAIISLERVCNLGSIAINVFTMETTLPSNESNPRSILG